MLTRYINAGSIALLFIIAIVLFLWKLPPSSAPGVTQAAADATARSDGARPPATFLSSHTPGAVFTPGSENVTPGIHVEMERLTTRLDAAPEDTAALFQMARLKQDGHQIEEAVAYYRRYLALRPAGRQAWLDLAQSYGALAQWDEALAATEDLLRRFPNDPAGLYNLGAIYANTSRFEEARAVWEQVAAQRRNPEMKTMADGSLEQLVAMNL